MRDIFLYCSVPGIFGGIAWFLYGFRKNAFKNNKLIKKLSIESLGALIVASFVGYAFQPMFAKWQPIVLFCFGTGACWSGILQSLRKWVTGHVEDHLG